MNTRSSNITVLSWFYIILLGCGTFFWAVGALLIFSFISDSGRISADLLFALYVGGIVLNLAGIAAAVLMVLRKNIGRILVFFYNIFLMFILAGLNVLKFYLSFKAVHEGAPEALYLNSAGVTLLLFSLGLFALMLYINRYLYSQEARAEFQ
ncbi:MAG: hypothetical protein PQJ58_06785 [Spirochaetales bacterium]|nr:hypothetical protein [Spirochaetales bacterium]